MSFKEEYDSHIATWAAHCGAPKSVYIGHLQKLIEAARAEERAGAAEVLNGLTALDIIDNIRAQWGDQHAERLQRLMDDLAKRLAKPGDGK